MSLKGEPTSQKYSMCLPIEPTWHWSYYCEKFNFILQKRANLGLVQPCTSIILIIYWLLISATLLSKWILAVETSIHCFNFESKEYSGLCLQPSGTLAIGESE